MTPTNMQSARDFYFAGLVIGVDTDDDTIDSDEYAHMLVRAFRQHDVPAALADDCRQALRNTEWWRQTYDDRAAEFLADPYCRTCGGSGWERHCNVHPYSIGYAYEEYAEVCDCTNWYLEVQR